MIMCVDYQVPPQKCPTITTNSPKASITLSISIFPSDCVHAFASSSTFISFSLPLPLLNLPITTPQPVPTQRNPQPTITTIHSRLNGLRRRTKHLLSPPKTSLHHTAKEEKDAQSDAESPHGFHLKASRLVRTGPDEVIHLGHVLAYARNEGVCGTLGIRQCGTVEVRERLADGDCDYDCGDEEERVQA